MIKVRVKAGTREVQDYWGYLTEVTNYVKGELINVFWHPTEGEKAAIVTERGEIETFKLEHVTVTGESA